MQKIWINWQTGTIFLGDNPGCLKSLCEFSPQSNIYFKVEMLAGIYGASEALRAAGHKVEVLGVVRIKEKAADLDGLRELLKDLGLVDPCYDGCYGCYSVMVGDEDRIIKKIEAAGFDAERL